MSGGETRSEKVAKAFSKMDKMLRMSSSFRSCIGFLTTNWILAGTPDCEKCGEKMGLNHKNQAIKGDTRGYSCKTCFTR
jgi:hypothetical protein